MSVLPTETTADRIGPDGTAVLSIDVGRPVFRSSQTVPDLDYAVNVAECHLAKHGIHAPSLTWCQQYYNADILDTSTPPLFNPLKSLTIQTYMNTERTRFVIIS